MNNKKIITVFGATGAQGGGLVQAILNDPGGEFVVRAVTRDPNSDKAKALAGKGAEIVEADIDDVESIKRALAGAYGAYFVTFFWAHFSPEKEKAEAAAMASPVISYSNRFFDFFPQGLPIGRVAVLLFFVTAARQGDGRQNGGFSRGSPTLRRSGARSASVLVSGKDAAIRPPAAAASAAPDRAETSPASDRRRSIVYTPAARSPSPEPPLSTICLVS